MYTPPLSRISSPPSFPPASSVTSSSNSGTSMQANSAPISAATASVITSTDRNGKEKVQSVPHTPTSLQETPQASSSVPGDLGAPSWRPLKEIDFPKVDEDIPGCYVPLLKGAASWEIPAFTIITSRSNGSAGAQLLEWLNYSMNRVDVGSPQTSADSVPRVHCIYKKSDVPDIDVNFPSQDNSFHSGLKELKQIFESYIWTLFQNTKASHEYLLAEKHYQSAKKVSRDSMFLEDPIQKNFDRAKTVYQNTTKELAQYGEIASCWGVVNRLLQDKYIDIRVQYSDQKIQFIRPQQGEEGNHFIALSPAEKLIVDIIAWQCYFQISSEAKGPFFHKKTIMLLDEPDRHFGPELCELYMSVLQKISGKHQVQIVMKSYRSETLSYAPSGSIHRIRLDQQNIASIIPVHQLEAAFILTHNTRALTNFHIKVYVESLGDATVYERVYTHLLEISEKIRQKNKNKAIPKEEVLSRRFQLSFYSLSLQRSGSGGSSPIIFLTVQRDMLALDNLDARSTTKTLIPRKVSYPLGLIDADTDLDHTLQIRADSTRITPAYQSIKSQLFFTKRYSLENYIYDPVFLFSLLNEEEINEWFAWNEEFRDHTLACQHELKAENISQKRLQDAFDAYFRYFIEQFIGTKVINLKGLDRFTQKMSLEDYNKLYGYLRFDQLPHASQSSSDSPSLSLQKTDVTKPIATESQTTTKKTKTPAHTGPVNVLDKLAEDLGINLTNYDTDQAKHTAIVNKLMQSQLKEIEILSPDGSHIYRIQYPGFFIYARGHDLEQFFQKKFAKDKDENGNNFNQWLTNKIATSPEPLTLPMDLVEIIRELNTRVREQARAVIKPHQLTAPSNISQLLKPKSKKNGKQKTVPAESPVSASPSSSSILVPTGLGKTIQPVHEVTDLDLAPEYDEKDLSDTFNAYFSRFITHFISSISMTEIEYNEMFGYLTLTRQIASQTESSESFLILKRLRTELEPEKVLTLEQVTSRLMGKETKKIVIRSTNDTQSYEIQCPSFFIRANSAQLKKIVGDDEFEKWLIESISSGSMSLTSPINLVKVIGKLDNLHIQAQANVD